MEFVEFYPPMKKPLCIILFTALVIQSNAALIDYDLIGTAGPGLLFLNEPVASGGTGGEIGAGIQLDSVSNVLTLNVGWGSSQGFTDLSSVSNNSHIHVAANNFGNNGTANFTQTGSPVLFNLTRSSSAVTGGTFTGPSNTITLTAAQVTDLNNGKYYINIHTANNGGGELRGFIVPVPEPSVAALLVTGAVGMLARRRRRV
jgi:hypothetical protein